MAGAQIRVELDGLEPSIAAVAAAAARLQDPAPLWDEIGLSLVTSTQMRFERGVTPAGNPWPPSIRVQLGQGSGKTLIESGRLMQSITHDADAGGVSVGTNVIYAAVHQFGDIIMAKNAAALHFKLGGVDVFVDSVEIPARPFLGVDQADQDEMIKIAADYILPEATDAR